MKYDTTADKIIAATAGGFYATFKPGSVRASDITSERNSIRSSRDAHNGAIRLAWDQAESRWLVVLDLLGRQRYRKHLVGERSQDLPSWLEPGVYFIRIELAGRELVGKVELP